MLSVSDLIEPAKVDVSAVLTRARSISEMVAEDLAALAVRDPAAHGDQWYCYHSSLSFRALLTYRVAHTLYSLRPPMRKSPPETQSLACAARLLSERGKVRTGVEIHPAAVVGRRMVIDHGWGTVIGEETRIGDDCYVLQNVVFGGRTIGRPANAAKRRHPKIGNRVVIAGDVCIFGPVTIGDDCRIDAGARITTDIPAKSRVRVRALQQVLESNSSFTSADRGM